MSYQALKQRHRNERDAQHPNLSLRVHRALSWLQRAEQADDHDGRFIFLWIAFNAAYATEIEERHRLTEQDGFNAFVGKLHALDESKRMDALVWKTFAGPIRVLLDTPYVFQSFWDWQNGKIKDDEWKLKFANGKKAAKLALSESNTPVVLAIVLNRMYTLRNQVMHGGATWNSSTNRKQLRDCTHLLEQLVPLIIELMMDNPDTLWGEACYPVVS
ncbi:HEPN domain-containing protein [Lampropedia aestuarii]|uniref:HEPN domain-containing protein n=1 Tax=Lampropedia aestuarii TaxID=2562762 RepID=UPI002468E9C6|nr:HEPN domain-containing protein [Lampropedia aestuarii]MDH5859190.1 HEPN domain-containing protein [Lampropedia aestuarii]